jgi:hypothetical protein
MKDVRKCEMDSSGSRGPVVSFCGQDNESYGSIKRGDTEQPSAYQDLKQDPFPWN